ncbi:MAG: CDP-alcohol phosphatidyltransferase family protein [Deltaproteobacteria bacterium]|nr:CDP-alcohol phosphatidyltransferase family protein [Deltaproteobacteria bacterium]
MRIELKDVIKSADVEDPVNLHVHRPLQLALVRPLVRTSITPNQVTFLSLCAGLGSAALIVKGTPVALLAAGVLLFSSAILDGVDGMIARLKKTSSETGHAIDGAADYAVNVSTTAAAVYYLAQRMNPLLAIALGLLAHLAWAQHLMLYDFHCATYLRFLTGGKHQGGDLDRGRDLLERLRARNASLFSRTLVAVYVWQLGNRQTFLERVNPVAASYRTLDADAETGAAYVARHRTTMRAWAFLGNAPHMDLMALATATGRFDLYFLLRIVGFTALAVILAVWERRVSATPLMREEEVSAA